MGKAGWYAAALLLSISSVLNAVAIVNSADISGRLGRLALSVAMGLLAALCVRKGMAAEST